MKNLNLGEKVTYFSSKKESLTDFFHQDSINFLQQFSPNRIKFLKRILKKIGFKFNGQFIVDLLMPMNVGGYFYDAKNIIAINPMILLYGTEKEIAHILFHEGLHAGIYTDSKVDDESLVESMTKKKMDEIYGGKTVKSGYDGMVDELKEFIGDLSFSEMTEMIENDDESTFNKVLELIVVNPAFANSDISELSWEEIKKKLSGIWGTLQNLFPRMMNSIAGRNVGPHATANMAVSAFKLDGVLCQAASKLLSTSPNLLLDIMENVIPEVEEDLTEENVTNYIYASGFGYLVDFDKEFVSKYIKTFITLRQIKKLDVQNFKLGLAA